jgi:hypothetical protein
MFVFPVVSPFRLRVSQHLDHATFPIPATSNAACGRQGSDFPVRAGRFGRLVRQIFKRPERPRAFFVFKDEWRDQ